MGNLQKPLVSVIVPTYNSQATIGRCLRSIKDQTYKRIEIIVVDRHSKDETTQIAKQYKVKLLFVTEERSTAKNYAARNAKGEFLLFLDSDMTLTSKTIEECINECLKKNVDAVTIPLKSTSQGLIGQCRKIERESLSNLSEFMEAPRFFKRKAFFKTGGFDEKLVCGEDFDFAQRFKNGGYKIGKVTSAIFHLEGNLSLFHILSKAYYYGKTFPALIKKKPREIVKRYVNIRLASLKTISPAFRTSTLILSFTLMKTLEFLAYFAGILIKLTHLILKKPIKPLKDWLLANRIIVINFTVLVLISIAIFRNFLFSQEWPGGGDVMGFISRAYLYGKDFRWLYMWRPYSFGFVENINAMDFFLMITFWIFRDPSWTVKVFMFLSYIIAAFSMYLFAYKYINKHVAALSASLIYVLNQWLFSQLTEAHVGIIFSYALAPLLFILFDNAFKTGKSKDIIFLSVGLSLFVTGFHPECIVIYGVFLVIFAFFFLFFPSKREKFKKRLYCTLKVSTLSFLLAFLLSAFFLFPFLANVRAPYFHLSYGYFIEEAFRHSYANMTDAFTLRAVENWGYINVVDVYSELGLPDFPVTIFFLFLLLSAYSTLLIRRDRYIAFFAFSTIISVFLAKGPNSPFGQFFIWAWSNIPYFSVFRAASRWIMMAIFSHAFFISLLVHYLTSYVEEKSFLHAGNKYFEAKMKSGKSSKIKKLWISVDLLNVLLKKTQRIIYILSIILLVFIFLSGFLSCFFFFSQGLQVYTPSEQYLAPYEWLAFQKDDYKVVSICRSPSEWHDPLSSESDFASSGMLTPLGWSHDIGFDSSFIHDKPLLQNGGWDFKARQFVDYLRFRLAREHLTENMYKILGPFAYYYIVIPSYSTNQTREFFLNQKGYRVLYNQSGMVLQNEYAAHRIFAANQSMFLVGGFESFDALCKIKSFDLSKTVLYYAPEYFYDDSLLYQKINQSQMFCFVNSNILDLAIISLGKDATLIHAADYGFSSLDMRKYWVKWSSWRIIGSYVLSGDVLTTVGNNKISFPFELSSEGLYNVYLRVGFAPSRGKLRLFVDGELIREFSPYFPLMSKIEWVNMGSLELTKGKHFITLENDGTGYNDIDAIAIVKPLDLEQQINEIMDNLQNFQGRLLYLLEAENAFLNSSNNDWFWTVKPYNGYVIRSESLGLNIAPLAIANATSQEEFMEAVRAIDGDPNTRWTSEKYVVPQCLELTWDTTQRLRGLRVIFENAYATDYAIQTWNGTCWINQVTVAGNKELERMHDFEKVVETNKLRIYITSFSDFSRVSIWELEVYSSEITSTSTTTLTIPREGRYMLAARVTTGPSYGKLYFQIGDDVYSIQCNSSTSQFEWHEVGPFHLTVGNVSINLSGVGVVELDEVLLYSLSSEEDSLSLSELFNSSSPNVSINYKKVNPCTYKVNINASDPFILIFSESYNPLWTAFSSGEEFSSTSAYSLVNSFYINKTGEFDIILYFKGQTYADIGLKTCLSTIVLIAIIVFIPKKKIERVKKQATSWGRKLWRLKSKMS